MFEIRGYNLNTKKIVFSPQTDVWQVFIRTAQGEKVMCVLTPTGGRDTVMEEQKLDISSTMFQGSNKTENIGMEFIKSLEEYGESNGVKLIVIISQSVTSYALRAISKSDINILHFTYHETNIAKMAKHIYHPLMIRRLSPAEKKIYISGHTLYHKELQRYSQNDALIKYHGFQLGDIIEYEDRDKQTGLVKEYGIVVMDL
jgi:DNA-directed RNA polymerase subunit H (RpoH/RPB5)